MTAMAWEDDSWLEEAYEDRFISDVDDGGEFADEEVDLSGEEFDGD